MNLTSRAALLLVGSVHFSKYIVFSSFSARIFSPIFDAIIRFRRYPSVVYQVLYLLVFGLGISSVICYIRMVFFCVPSRQNGPLDSSEYKFSQYYKLFSLVLSHTVTHTRVVFGILFVRSFVRWLLFF